MKTNNKIEKTINVLDDLGDVKVSPFFKDKVMQQLFSEKEQKQSIWSWFTPQLQLATLVCVVGLNIFAFIQLDTQAIDPTEIDEFALTYDLSITEDATLFN